MARTTLNKTTLVGPYPASVPADSLDFNFQAADVANKNQFSPSGDDEIIMWNSGASPYTVTITSAPDPMNRTGDIATYSLAAGDIAGFRIKNMGWVQSDGKVYLEASNAAVKFAIVALA
jgi:hypothetical protein